MQNLATLAALGFASARGTQFVVYDSLADPFRERLELWHARNHTGYWRSFWRDLLSCVYCTGFHLSWITLVVYLTAAGQWGAAPLLVHAIEAWAVAAVQMLINRWDSSLDHRHGGE